MDLAREGGAEVDVADFHEFDMPLYDGDMLTARDSAGRERARAPPRRGRTGLLIASPEYNFSLPGTLKNAIDWVSRINPVPFRGKTALLLRRPTARSAAFAGSGSFAFRSKVSA